MRARVKKHKTVLRRMIVAVMAFAFMLANSAFAQAFRHLSEGDLVPGFKLSTVTGEVVDYAAPTDVAIVLTFVKLGQEKSEAVMRELVRLDKAVGEKTQVLALVINPQDGDVAAWAKGLGADFPVLLDKNEEVYSKYGVMVSPQTALISPDGKLKGEVGGHTAEYKREVETKLRVILGMPAVEDKSAAVAKDLPEARKKALRELQKAHVLLKRKMKSKAIPQAKMATEADDTYVEAHTFVAELLLDEGGDKNIAEAEKHINRVVELDPNDSAGKVGLARIKAKKGDVPGAVSLLETAAKITPKPGKMYYYLGVILQDSGNLQKAVEAYRTAVEKLMAEYE